MILIRGNSGCNVEIVNCKKASLVRKSSSDPAYYERLRLQCEKQSSFYELNSIDFVETPRIHDKKFIFEEDVCYFDMDFYRSLDCITFLHRCSVSEVKFLTNSIKEVIEKNIEKSTSLTFQKDIFLSKYEDVKRKISNSKFHFLTNSRVKNIDEIFRTLDEKELPTGICHGDLTLSNILIRRRNKKICLIDFLDTFLESPIQDLVKIRQDTLYGWSLHLYSNTFDVTKMSIILSHMDRDIDNHFKKYEFYRYFYQSFQIMNLLRLLQYCSSESIIENIVNNIDQLITDRV